MAYRLYDFPASPFCIKIRALLDYKGIAFERINVSGPRFLELRRLGGPGKVPVLDMDGDVVFDSTDIAYAIEEAHPTPPALPESPRDRALCHVLEDWADESLSFYGLYYRWQEPRGRKEAASYFRRGPFGALVAPMLGVRARRQLNGQGIGRKAPGQIARELDRELQSLSALLEGRDYFIGERPSLADFALLGQLLYLGRTPVGGEVLGAHASLGEFLERMKALRKKARAAT